MIEYIPSVSFGKDSTAMLLMMLEMNEPIHSVLYFDTEREFPEIKNHARKLKANLNSKFDFKLNPELNFKLKFRTVRHWIGFDFLEARYAAAKRDTCDRYMRLMLKDNPDIIECIGFSADEQERADKMLKSKSKKWPVRFPLIERGITEKMALEYCYDHGYFFEGIYEWMPSKRVSCYDCPKQSKADWAAIQEHHPELIRR